MSSPCVPLYDSLGENAIEFIINHAEASVAFVATEKLPNLVKALPKTKEVLKTVVYWGEGNKAAIEVGTRDFCLFHSPMTSLLAFQSAKGLGYSVYSFEELKSLGASSPAESVPPKSEELCTIMYTSGTTGDPKGVMLTHKAVLAGVANIVFYCKINNINFNETDSMISYLPLAHIFDR